MDDDGVVARMARAAVAAGAVAVRIEGARRLAVVRQAVEVPVIGIVKRDLADSPVRITPFVEDVRALAAAGADIVAVDVTRRTRPAPVRALHEAILLLQESAYALHGAPLALLAGFVTGSL
jgi:N-acylglucosamine-6-phosphate 2-epimerase